jgi:cephalosporin-C deacetylase
MVSGGLRHALPFDPAYGYDLASLLSISSPVAPPDFADFWRYTYQEARAIALDLRVEPVAMDSFDADVFEVSFRSWGGARIQGWMTLPKDRHVERGLVISHGYGGRDGPDPWLPTPHTAAIFPCARGLGRSSDPRIPAASHEHVLHGIERRDDYVHRGCVADVWAAASALEEFVPDARSNLAYIGASFGGGIGALALPWDDRFTRAFLEAPSFGHHPLRLQLQSVGSAEAVRSHALRHPEVRETLAYYDASVAAGFIHVPTLVAAALFDPAVPPPGQFAIYNAIRSEKHLVVLKAAHFDYAESSGQGATVRAALIEFMADASEPDDGCGYTLS